MGIFANPYALSVFRRAFSVSPMWNNMRSVVFTARVGTIR